MWPIGSDAMEVVVTSIHADGGAKAFAFSTEVLGFVEEGRS
ncbi:MAG TPA: hypothetical protein VF188_05870 [Longimicrobiales bacterium]